MGVLVASVFFVAASVNTMVNDLLICIWKESLTTNSNGKEWVRFLLLLYVFLAVGLVAEASSFFVISFVNSVLVMEWLV